MDVRRSLAVVSLLGFACLPLGATQQSSDPVLAAASSGTGSLPEPGPENKTPVDPQEELPDPFTPAQSAANAESGAIGDLVSGLAGFAGLWVGQDGMVHVAVQRAAADNFRAILAEGFSGRYQLTVVQHSYLDLMARRDAISNQTGTLKELGLVLMDWGPNESHNTVQVSLVDYTETKAELVRKLLGSDVIVNPSATVGGTGDLFSLSLQPR